MTLMGCLDRVRHELRVLGPWLFALPLLIALGLSALTTELTARHINSGFVVLLPAVTLEACLPLAAALVVMAVAVHDDAIELQLSLPLAYTGTALLRSTLLVGWVVLVEIATMLALRTLLPAALPAAPAEAVLLWLAPTLWLAAAGALLATILRNRAAAGALLGTVWLAQLTFHGYFASQAWTRPWFLFATLFAPGATYWWSNRAVLLGMAVVFGGVVWLVFARPERRLRVEEE
jgi:hypothetical protein